ncbi:MAG: hypothetical protein M0R50_08805 [Candidatus Cloacimonetes bacterium]|jgi:hypothetical protein|nr:hypothetical protein [Candidatus Cloacimonadota bacterium]
MMAKAPIYDIGQVVYLKESAALGFLEAYIIKDMAYQPTGKLVYTLITSLKQPDAVMTIGDRVTGRLVLPIKFFEEDLIDYKDALEICITSLTTQLANLTRSYNALA